MLVNYLTHPPSGARVAWGRNAPGTKRLVPGAWYQALGTKRLVPSAWYQVLGTKRLVPSAWYQALGTKRLVASAWYQALAGMAEMLMGTSNDFILLDMGYPISLYRALLHNALQTQIKP